MKYETAYFCAYSKMPSNVTACEVYGSLTLGLKINLETQIVEDASVTLLSELAMEMIRSYFVGKKVVDDYDEIVDEITNRHQGGVCKALIKAYTDIKRNYVEYVGRS